MIAAPAAVGGEVLFGPPPDWVEPVDQPWLDEAAGSSANDELPARILLNDYQLRLMAGRQIGYSSLAIKIQNPQSLSVGNLSLAWRQDVEDLTVHKVIIRRSDGEAIKDSFELWEVEIPAEIASP